MTTQPPAFAHSPELIRLGDLEVVRLGYGAMRLPGPDVWGEPEDPACAREVLRRVVALGMNLIDSAWYYGPLVANRLIAETPPPSAWSVWWCVRTTWRTSGKPRRRSASSTSRA
jgi:aryl-alcohol dehydrogenase-like predicted oxidoreductase